MKLLLDTHIVLWAAGQPERLSESARTLLTTPENILFFSVASIWEIVIKRGLGRDDFKVNPRRLREMLIMHGYSASWLLAQSMSLRSNHSRRFTKTRLIACYWPRPEQKGCSFSQLTHPFPNTRNPYCPFNIVAGDRSLALAPA